jgi:hypothetical protein
MLGIAHIVAARIVSDLLVLAKVELPDLFHHGRELSKVEGIRQVVQRHWHEPIALKIAVARR